MGLKGSGGPFPCWWSIMDSTVLSGGHHSSLSRVYYIVFIRFSFSQLQSLTYRNIIRDICLESNEYTRFFHILVNSVVYFTLHNYVQKSCTSGILDHQMILNQCNWIMNANQYCFYFQNWSKYHQGHLFRKEWKHKIFAYSGYFSRQYILHNYVQKSHTSGILDHWWYWFNIIE